HAGVLQYRRRLPCFLGCSIGAPQLTHADRGLFFAGVRVMLICTPNDAESLEGGPGVQCLLIASADRSVRRYPSLRADTHAGGISKSTSSCLACLQTVSRTRTLGRRKHASRQR